MMKINTPFLIIAFAALCTNISMINCMEQIEQNLHDMLKQDLTIKVKLPKKEFYFIAHTLQLCTKKDNQLIGEALYVYYPQHQDTIKLDALKITKEFRNYGIGEQFFYLIMYTTLEQYPSIEKVVWEIVPFDQPINSSTQEAYNMLFKFYRRVGATVNEITEKGLLDLKKAGYLDKNLSKLQHNIMIDYEQEKAVECPKFFKSIPYAFIAILLTAYFFSSHA